jgi:hypothetical protein
MACKVFKKEGSILLSAVSIISILGIVVLMVEVVLTPLITRQRSLDLTAERLNEVKEAIFSSPGGFINDYGEPDNKDNFIRSLLKRPEGWQLWHYGGFWAGYRGERYLSPPSGQSGTYEKYLDGFGLPIEASFDGDAIRIAASHEIEETFLWKREVEIRLRVTKAQEHPNPITIKLRLTYPEKGNLSFEEEEKNIDLINGKGSAVYTFSKKKFAAGMRKIEVIWNETLIKVDVLRIPPARTDSTYRKELKVNIVHKSQGTPKVKPTGHASAQERLT